MKKVFRKLIVLLGALALLAGFRGILPGIFPSQGFKGGLTLSDSYLELEGLASENAIVVRRSTGEILMGRQPMAKIHPASMTKVMTALIGLEQGGSLSRRVEISQDIVDYCRAQGLSMSGFEAGDRPRLRDLVYGILLESGAESSLALSRELAGSQEGFVQLMNERARELGMEDTHFSNVTGMTDLENYTSPRDMALLFNQAAANPKFRKIARTKDYRPRGSDHTIANNLFFKRNVLDINKDYIQYGKTGYTEMAGLCLVSLGQLEREEYIVVTAKAKGNPHSQQYNLMDTEKIYEKLKEGL